MNVKNAHRKGHQSEDGHLDGGEWKCEQTFKDVQNSVRQHLQEECKEIAPSFGLQQKKPSAVTKIAYARYMHVTEVSSINSFATQ